MSLNFDVSSNLSLVRRFHTMEKLQKCVNFILTVPVFFLQPTVCILHFDREDYFFDSMGRCKLKKNAVPKIKKHVTLGSDQILHPINDQILPSPIPVPHEEKVVSCGVPFP
jgi:hypothetical protein